MSNTMFKDLFNEMESGQFNSSIPAGTYDVVVTDARVERNKFNVIFLTLQVLTGPAAEKSTELTLNIPKEGDKPFTFTKFKSRIAGFGSYPDVKAAFESSANAPSREAQLDLFAQAFLGKKVTADIGLRGKDAGDYAGSNELNATQPPAGGPAASAPTAEPAAAAAPVTVEDNGAQVPQKVAPPF